MVNNQAIRMKKETKCNTDKESQMASANVLVSVATSWTMMCACGGKVESKEECIKRAFVVRRSAFNLDAEEGQPRHLR